jgi:hypothetical protein
MPSSTFSTTLRHKFAKAWRARRERRTHDSALRDQRLAAEHSIADSRATSRGRAGCKFCHS